MVSPSRCVRPDGLALLGWARATLRQKLGGATATRPTGSWTDAPGATFVTLRWPDGDLQGCIGRLEPSRAIAADVAENVIAAALRDPRARPLVLRDVDRLSIELSVLSPLELVTAGSEAAALALLRPDHDGVVLDWRGRRATFLPSMWSQLGDGANFLRQLRRKAGIPADLWDGDVRLYRYGVEKFTDAPVT
jgi:AmmeMemoRadiSam system protein A